MPCTRIEHHVPGRVHPFFLFTACPSFGSPFKLALLGLHPKEPVNDNTRIKLITV